MAHQAGVYLDFCSMKRLGVFVLPSGLYAGHRRVTPSIKFAGTQLYTWVERGIVRVKCLAQEHNTMPLARAQTRTALSGMWPPASHRCYNNCIKQMPKHWWASLRRKRSLLQKNNPFETPTILDLWVFISRMTPVTFFNRILISTSSLTFLARVK